MAEPTMHTPVKDPLRRRAVAISVASVAALAVAAAVIGWLIGSTGSPGGEPVANGTSLSGSPSSTQTQTNSPTPGQTSTSPSSSATVPGGLPNFAGRPFLDVFHELRLLKVGVRVVFEGSGDDATVDRTDPGPGTVVRSGTNVTIYVKGGPAMTTVPNLIGLSCDTGSGTAGSVLYEAGLAPTYGQGRDGVVIAQSPDSTSQTTRWNEIVEVTCGASPPASPLGATG